MVYRETNIILDTLVLVNSDVGGADVGVSSVTSVAVGVEDSITAGVSYNVGVFADTGITGSLIHSVA
jgi:hypothetical protein